jgi:hypothetical protein
MAAPGPAIQHPDENEGPILLGSTLAITILALITMVARLYVRIRMIRNVGWDVSFLAVCATCSLLTLIGLLHGPGNAFGQLLTLLHIGFRSRANSASQGKAS